MLFGDKMGKLGLDTHDVGEENHTWKCCGKRLACPIAALICRLLGVRGRLQVISKAFASKCS